jgi:hypothetical protein
MGASPCGENRAANHFYERGKRYFSDSIHEFISWNTTCIYSSVNKNRLNHEGLRARRLVCNVETH